MNVLPLDPMEARALALAVEGQWVELTTAMAPNVAMLTTFAAELTPDELARVFGPDLLEQAAAALDELKKLHHVVSLLENGTAVLVPWQELPEPAINIAVVHRSMLPAGSQLGAWPVVVVAGLGVGIATAAVIFKFFDLHIVKLRETNSALRIKMFERLSQNAAAINKTDPAFAAKLLAAAEKATAAEVAATGQGKSWLDRMLAGMGAAGQALPFIAVVAAILWFASQRGTRRAAA